MTVISIALMVVDHRGNYLHQLRAFLDGVVAPVQYLVDKPSEAIQWLESSVSSRQAMLKDNARLQAEILLLQSRLQQFLSVENENRQLRALLQSSPRNAEHVEVARVLAVASDPYAQEIILVKGKENGVQLGQAVLDANGVLGQVVRVSRHTSRVLLLTDNRFAIPVENSRNSIRGIVAGIGLVDSVALTHIPQTADVQVGDTLVTSGLGQRFPAGYPVGKITKVEHNPGEHFSSITVTPSAQVNRTRLVLLVWKHEQKQT